MSYPPNLTLGPNTDSDTGGIQDSDLVSNSGEATFIRNQADAPPKKGALRQHGQSDEISKSVLAFRKQARKLRLVRLKHQASRYRELGLSLLALSLLGVSTISICLNLIQSSLIEDSMTRGAQLDTERERLSSDLDATLKKVEAVRSENSTLVGALELEIGINADLSAKNAALQVELKSLREQLKETAGTSDEKAEDPKPVRKRIKGLSR